MAGWAIPDAIEIRGKKTRKPPAEHMFNNQVVFVSRKYCFIFFTI